MRTILNQSEAKQIFDPYVDRMVAAFQEAFNTLQYMLNAANENGPFKEYSATAKATMLHDLIKNSIREAFPNCTEHQTVTVNKIFGLRIGELFIRFKKFNLDFSVAGIPTKQFRKYEKQMPITGFPKNPTLLIAGYIPNKTWTQISGIYLACRVGGGAEWVEPLLNKTNAAQTVFPFAADPQPTGTPRIKVKNPNEPGKQQTGTDD